MISTGGKTSSTRRPVEYDSDEETQKLRLDSLVSRRRTPKLVYYLTFVASIGGFLVGYDTGSLSGALLLLREIMMLNAAWQEAIVSAVIASAAVFACLSGILSDRVGRKPVLMASSVMFTLGSVCTSVAVERYILLTGKLIVGAGLGLLSTSAGNYLAECVPTNMRGKLVGCQAVMVSAGLLISNIIAGLFSSNMITGWRYILGLGAIPSSLMFLGLFFLPESPHWLVSAGRDLDARVSLQKLRGEDDVEEEFDGIQATCVDVKRQAAQAGCEDKSILSKMWQTVPVRRALLVGGFIQLVQQATGINAILYYSALIIKSAGVQSNAIAIWLSAVTAFVHFLGTLLGLILTEKLGRRILTLASLSGVIVCLAWLAVGFHLSSTDTPTAAFEHRDVRNTTCYSARSCYECIQKLSCGFCDYPSRSLGVANGSCITSDARNPWRSQAGRCNTSMSDGPPVWAYDFCPSSFTWIPLLGLLFYLVSFSPGMGLTPSSIISEIFPAWSRVTGMTVCTVINWAASLVVASSFLTLNQTITAYGTFWLFGSLSLAGVIALGCVLPETKNRSAEEVEDILARLWSNRTTPTDYNTKTIQYVHIRGLNRDGAISELDSPE